MTEIKTLRPVDVKRAKFDETSRVAQEYSDKRLQNDRDKTERLRALRLARERGNEA
jgi:hypothetical protein